MKRLLVLFIVQMNTMKPIGLDRGSEYEDGFCTGMCTVCV